jgi:hypothetical protein
VIFVGEFLQLLVQAFFVAEEDHPSAKIGLLVLNSGCVNFFDQTGHRFAELAREDCNDRAIAVRSDQAGLGAGELARNILWVERHGHLADLRPRFHGVRSEQAAGEQHDRQGRPYGDAMSHRNTNLLLKNPDSELPKITALDDLP